ncbi:MAG: hypothetical protein ACJAZT_001682 [Gammaproteobacteria bacterium]|jgi:hypothetical protein
MKVSITHCCLPAFRTLCLFLIFCSIQACDHPLAIEGEGDIVDLNGSGHGCTLELFQGQDVACTKNTVVFGYDVNYEAVPREGWEFVGWAGVCSDKGIGNCALKVPASAVKKSWFKVMPSTIAIFALAEGSNNWNTDNWDEITWQ